MLGVVAALFGLLFAFVIVIAYQNFTDAQGNVSDEADALAAVVRDSGAFPQPQRDHVRAAVGVYVRAVVDEEWPRMRQGKDSARRLVGRRRHVHGATGIRPGLAEGDVVLRRFRAAAERRAGCPAESPRRRGRRPALGDRRTDPGRLCGHHRLRGAGRVDELLVSRDRGRIDRPGRGPVARRARRPDLSLLGRPLRRLTAPSARASSPSSSRPSGRRGRDPGPFDRMARHRDLRGVVHRRGGDLRRRDGARHGTPPSTRSSRCRRACCPRWDCCSGYSSAFSQRRSGTPPIGHSSRSIARRARCDRSTSSPGRSRASHERACRFSCAVISRRRSPRSGLPWAEGRQR